VKCFVVKYEGQSKSSRPDLVLFRIKFKWYLFLIIAAKLRTRHAQFDCWAINILYILAVVSCLLATWKKGVTKMTNLTDSFVSSHVLLF